VAHPIIWALNQAANLVLRALGVQPKDEIAAAFTGEEVARLIAESRNAGLLDRADQELLTSALELADKTAAAIAVPVADLVMVPARATPWAVQQATAQTGFSRLLLHETSGALVGYIHVKDTLDAPDPELPLPAELVRPLPTVAGATLLTDAIGILRRSGSHLARVCDANGAVAGVLFLEDALEELIGEVHDPAHPHRS
jgi:CBS domain containing-hemolysin-like protein